ncbi:cytochrome c oxidase subunit II [Halostella salina]|uniref:cytochrome c oxidase subunit II n=1 Tax=Halostella salina TaxID=1547897 RepID=UPI000EF83755|nr:cytochrome c oxidase subunit II [Halostella salina]
MPVRFRRAALATLAAAGLLTLFVAPAAAQSVNRELIDDLNTQLLYVALPLTVFVEVILIYAVVRFRDNETPKPTIDSPPLEVTWTIATAIILLFVGVSAYVVLTSPYISTANDEVGPTDERVHALGYQWGWQFTYPEANVTTQDLLVIPAERNVSVGVTSADVLHSLFVPELGVKQDAFPGKNTTIRTYATETGTYRAYCTEICGAGHSRMRADVVVVDNETYREWLAAHEGETGVTAAPGEGGNETAANATPAQSLGVSVQRS